MRVWTEKSITDTYESVMTLGRAIIPCETPRAAKLFRQALYGHKRRHVGLPEISARVDGQNLIVTKRSFRTPNGIQDNGI